MLRLLLSAAAFLTLSLPPAFAAEADQENVLVLIVDDMGMDKTGIYGFLNENGDPLAARTPNIDRLARRGMLFRKAWAAPACSTCRAEVLTGKYPNRTGIGNRIPFNEPTATGLRADEITLPDIIPPNYATGIIGKWHLSGSGSFGSLTSGIDHAPRCGFRFHVGSKGNLADYLSWTKLFSFLANLAASYTEDVVDDYATSRTTTDALRTIQALGDRPFFLWVAYNAPHKPLHVPPAHLIQSPGLDLGSDIGMAKAMIEALDTEIGRLFDGIDPEVLARTTVFWFSDNGTHKDLVERPWDPTKAKATVYNGGVHVPFLVMSRRIPPQLRGTECERLIDITDIMPTVAEMLGVPTPTGIDGKSFLSYLGDPNAPASRPWIFAERFRPNFVPQPGVTISQVPLLHHDQAVRDSRYKLLRRRRFSTSGQVLFDALEFYDVELDFFETRNLLDNQGNPPTDLQSVYDGLLQVLDQMAS